MGKLSGIFRRKKTDSSPNNKDELASPRGSRPGSPDTLLPPPPPPVLVRGNSGVAAAVQERLAKEVLRKLRLATEAEEKEDRDIVCSEVFADITGELNAAAQGKFSRMFPRFLNYLIRVLVLYPYLALFLLSCREHWGYLPAMVRGIGSLFLSIAGSL